MPNDDWKTLRVPPDAYEKAQEQRKENGRKWGEQIVRPDGDADATPGVDAVIEALDEDVERLAELIEAIPERTADELMARLE